MSSGTKNSVEQTFSFCMNTVFTIFCTMCLLGCCSFSQKKGVEEKQDMVPISMWRVSGEATETSYLMGTCHIGLSMEEAVARRYESVLEECRLLVLESKTDHSLEKTYSSFRKHLFMQETSLEEILGEDRFTAISNMIPVFAPIVLDKMDPRFLLLWLVFGITEQNKPDWIEKSMDRELYFAAEKNGVRTVYLEEQEEQMSFFMEMQSMEEAIEKIDEIIKNPEATSEVREEILSICSPGFEPGSLERGNVLEGELMEKRNKEWVEKLLPMLEKGGVLVAVGAGHIWGSEGIVELLEERGFKVERVYIGKEEICKDCVSKTGNESRGKEIDDNSDETDEERNYNEMKRKVKDKIVCRDGFLEAISVLKIQKVCEGNNFITKCFDMKEYGCWIKAGEIFESCASRYRKELPETFTMEEGLKIKEEIGICTVMSYIYWLIMEGKYKGGPECEKNR